MPPLKQLNKFATLSTKAKSFNLVMPAYSVMETLMFHPIFFVLVNLTTPAGENLFAILEIEGEIVRRSANCVHLLASY
jgi:hypothetical protein